MKETRHLSPVKVIEATDTETVTDKTMIPATEGDLADEWIRRYGDHLRFGVVSGKWFHFDGVTWSQLETDAIPASKFVEMSRDIMCYSDRIDGKTGKSHKQDATDWLLAAARISGTLRRASSDALIQINDRDDLDGDPHLFNVQNGTVDLRTGALRPHRADDMLVGKSPIEYDLNNTAPEFHRFLEQVLPDPEVRQYLKRFFGMALLGKVEEHVFPVFVGTGSNGKSVLLRIIGSVFSMRAGGYATGLQKSVLVETKFEQHSTVLMTLKNKRLAVAEELERDSRWNVAMVKSLTGGGEITARRMRQDDETFEPSHSLVMATNHRPAVGDGEDAFWRRYREIVFPVKISEEEKDVHLADRIIENELPGILNWMLGGLREYQDAGRLDTPEAVRRATENAKEESDPLVMFVEDVYEVTGMPGDRVGAKELLDAYNDWKRGNLSAPALTHRSIRSRVIAAHNATGGTQLQDMKTKTSNVVAGLKLRDAKSVDDWQQVW